ncbi:MAG: CRISPR-associated helicase/endonuclease Cas3 [Bacteroidia bacterium]|nr:MAG: CRISPR-associated helicase/endonuclease Cas3 [Bacteroidia bacterium]
MRGLLLAKSDPPIALGRHTRHVWLAARSLLRRASPGDKALLRHITLWHDAGKVHAPFQARLYKKAGKGDFLRFGLPLLQEKLPEVPHSLFSLLWMDEGTINAAVEYLRARLGHSNLPDERLRQILFSVVAYHHWRDRIQEEVATPDKLSSLVQGLLETPRLREKYQELLCKELGERGIGWNEALARGLAAGLSLSYWAPPPYLNEWLPQRLGFSTEEVRLWISLAGTLQRADHWASAYEQGWIRSLRRGIYRPRLSQTPLRYFFLHKSAGSAWQSKTVKAISKKSAIVVAPTGAGKTELAFLWATPGRFIYTLPLRAAVFQTFRRAERLWGRKRVGLLYGDALTALARQTTEEVALAHYETARHLALPALITTGDQIFPYSFRPPGYERIYTTLQTHTLIVDEVQAYDPQAAALIVRLLEDIASLGGRFLLITATLPPFLEKELQSLNAEKIDLYANLDSFCKHKVEVLPCTPTSKEDFPIPETVIQKIADILAGKVAVPYLSPPHKPRILVVCNTRHQAMRMYEELEKRFSSTAEIDLLHSLFTAKDRREKEEALTKSWGPARPPLQKPHILVATQVVEAALDLYGDVLFTELAPADALVQRMGRVARQHAPLRHTPPPPPETPNVYIWFYWDPDKAKPDKLASGSGKIYKSFLLAYTLIGLKVLCETIKPPAESPHPPKSDPSEHLIQAVENTIRKTFLSLISPQEPENEEKENEDKKEKKKGRARIMPLTYPTTACLLCEKTKKLWVELLYSEEALSLPEGKAYLKAFYQTLEAARRGWVSDTREEAQQIFRRIAAGWYIPAQFKEAVEEALQEYKTLAQQKKLSSVARRLWWQKRVHEPYAVSLPQYMVGDREPLRDAPRFARDYAFLPPAWKYTQDKGLLFARARPQAEESFLIL